METEKNIDLTYLKQLSNGSNQFIVEMIDAFFEQVPIEIDNLERHLNMKDWKSVRGVAHKMKPSIAFMGIKKLESVIKLTEEYAGNETNLDLLPEMISKIKTVCNNAILELETEKKLFF
jgi:HPt (histidine-containing phosphotransfer) domain-containing protein